MSRDNWKNTVRRRSLYTGEAHQKALRTMPGAGDGPPWILDAPTQAQQLVESAVLDRLVQGARAWWPEGGRPQFPLFVEAVSPSADGLELVVTAGKAAAFGAALTGHPFRRARSLGEAINVRQVDGTSLHITVAGAVTGLVELCCAWPDLRTAIGGLPGAVVSSAGIRLRGGAGRRPAEDERAVLSSLLRRIALFAAPGALNWLFAWHRWLLVDRRGAQPRPPESLLLYLTDEGLGLGPLSRHALGLDGPFRPRTAPGTTPLPKPDKAKHPDAPVHPPVSPETQSLAASTDQDKPASGVYRHLAVTALRLDPDNPIPREYYLMRFPPEWIPVLAELATPKTARRGGHVSIAELNEAITAVLPDCVVTRQSGDDAELPHWLLAVRPVPHETIFRLVLAWVRSQNATEAQIDAVLAQLRLSDLSWQPVQIGPGLPFELLAPLVSMDIAERLSQPNAPVPFANLRFVCCPNARGAEVMSWPPQETDSAAFSVTIKISVQTRPFTTAPSVHMDFGIRRWMPVRGRLTVGRTHPAYLAIEPSAEGRPKIERSFGIVNITLARDTERGWQPQWSPALIRILTHAGLLHLLPDAQALVADPSPWLKRPNPVALPYRADMLAWHKVSDGLPVIDRAGLMDWAIGELAPHLHPVPPLPRAAARVYPNLTRAASTTIPADVLAEVVGPHLTVELCSQTTSGNQHTLSRLGQLLGTEIPPIAGSLPSETAIDLGPVTVTLRSIPPTSSPTNLVPDRTGAGTLAMAYAQRITHGLDQAAHPTVSLMETALEDVPGSRPGDLKTALRHALAATGRLSGFVAPAEPQDAAQSRDVARFARAVDDLFGQLGVRPDPLPTPAPNTVRCSPALLSIWMIHGYEPGSRRVRQPLPLAVLIDPTGRHVQIRTPWSPWQPLHIGLLTLAQHHEDASTTIATDPVRFIKDAIEHAIAAHPDTLLLTHAQNLRHAWPHLTNSHLDVNTIDLGEGPQPISTLPGLRHVRVRSSHGAETPQSYGINGTTIGHSKGMWRFPEKRLFASTSGKPAFAMDSALHNSKIAEGDRYGRTTRFNARAQVWNEQLLELAIAGLQDGDQPDQWAALVHNLRDAAPYIHWTTPLPWPLQLAQQIEEYLPRSDHQQRDN